MSTRAQTLDAIARMDGLALTLAAHTLGLSPEGHVLWRGEIVRPAGVVVALEHTDRLPWWQPDRDLAQALAILHRLEAQGWTTSRVWDAPQHHGVYQVYLGDIQARGDWGEPYRFHDAITRGADPTEALACLRCCVLGMALLRAEEGV